MSTKIKKARTIKDIQNHPLMARLTNGKVDFYQENDGGELSYWGYVKSGYMVYGNEQHGIHEPTIKRFCNVLNEVEIWEDDPELKD